MNEILQTGLITTNTLLVAWLIKKQYAGGSYGTSAGGVVLDSCALIDGRIQEVISAGFVDGDIVVPQFVLRELQMLADGSDTHKRARARYGLEVAEQLRQAHSKRFVLDESIRIAEATDELLIKLAKKRGSKLCTTDYNLNKVAAVEGVVVLNVNELSQSLRPTYMPGDEREVKILQKGESRGQGVGYLDDGTMVVVEHGAKYIGTKQTVVIERSLQTVAGKMSFAHLKKRN